MAAAACLSAQPKIKGVDVETHLRFAVKEYLETHKLTRKKYKPKRVRDRRSVRCSGRYGERRDKERMEMKFSKLKRLSNKPFVAGNPIKESERWKATPLNVGEPFIEQYQIQMTTKQLQVRRRRQQGRPPGTCHVCVPTPPLCAHLPTAGEEQRGSRLRQAIHLLRPAREELRRLRLRILSLARLGRRAPKSGQMGAMPTAYKGRSGAAEQHPVLLKMRRGC